MVSVSGIDIDGTIEALNDILANVMDSSRGYFRRICSAKINSALHQVRTLQGNLQQEMLLLRPCSPPRGFPMTVRLHVESISSALASPHRGWGSLKEGIVKSVNIFCIAIQKYCLVKLVGMNFGIISYQDANYFIQPRISCRTSRSTKHGYFYSSGLFVHVFIKLTSDLTFCLYYLSFK